MGVAPHPRRQLLLRGEAHGAFGECASATDPIGRSAGAISAGGDYVRLWKAHQAVPNEDCAFACDDGERTLLVVCDGHHGRSASHALVDAFAAAVPPDALPDGPDALAELVARALHHAGEAEPAAIDVDEVDSATTMLVVLVDRRRRRLFGLCSGDSSALVVPPAGRAVPCSEKGDDYLVPWRAQTFTAWPPRSFAAAVVPGDLVVLISDGIDECHRHHPETSIRLRHLEQLRARHAEPGAFAVALVDLALRGVDGNPGGQDNATALVTRC
ncbi:MAG: protein phosphatase 2C domain-containing protein [Planctomycetes bacterium]|nr:protein phosphatase 2C domain-containing protein [Planctomycetota bacterium]